jgi:secreted trypsin-like serine protease
MKMRLVGPVIAAACLVLSACENSVTRPIAPGSASRIIYGQATGAAHPAVVLIVMDVAGQPAFRCSGMLIAPKRVLTAGHCTGEPGEFSGMRVFTESDVENGNNNYPFNGPNTVPATAWHSHPLFTEATFFLHDVGVIELQSPVVLPAAEYGQLPAVSSLDALHAGRGTEFTTVGYGVQRINPAFVVEEKIRMSAQPWLIEINTPFVGGFSIFLSNNAATGGSCFGDSGGPNFVGTSNVIGGLTSFGLSPTCGGTGGVFRLDRSDVLSFIQQYLH